MSVWGVSEVSVGEGSEVCVEMCSVGGGSELSDHVLYNTYTYLQRHNDASCVDGIESSITQCL